MAEIILAEIFSAKLILTPTFLPCGVWLSQLYLSQLIKKLILLDQKKSNNEIHIISMDNRQVSANIKMLKQHLWQTQNSLANERC